MCVLTFIPTSQNGFILTSNRDEATARIPAIPPKKYMINGSPVFFPKDPQGQGTWIGGCGNFTLCLLNGAFQKHVANPPYRQSRGKVILDFYQFKGVEDFIERYDFDGIEPFTLVIIETGVLMTVNEIRWDGLRAYHQIIPSDQPTIWSSSTLYSDEIIKERQGWFKSFLSQNTPISAENMIDFHHHGGKGDVQNDIKMNRNNQLKTISITQFKVDDTDFTIRYEDLVNSKKYDYRVFVEC